MGGGAGAGLPTPKEGSGSKAQAAAVTQWLGLQGAFPEPQTALYSLRATCPAETLSHYSQLLLTPLCTSTAQHITYSHSVPEAWPRGSWQICPVPSLTSPAQIPPAHPHLSHWDRDPETLAHSTLTAVALRSVLRNGAGGEVTEQRIFQSQGWKGPPQRLSRLPSRCVKTLQGPHVHGGQLFQEPQEQEPLCSERSMDLQNSITD